jgi:hypothetical protein
LQTLRHEAKRVILVVFEKNGDTTIMFIEDDEQRGTRMTSFGIPTLTSWTYMSDLDEPSATRVVKQHTNLSRLSLGQLIIQQALFCFLHAVFISSATVIETIILLSLAPLSYLATFQSYHE